MYEFRAAVDVRVILNNHKGQTISWILNVIKSNMQHFYCQKKGKIWIIINI